ncbi:MAG: AEC family transporter [Alphaproteobacteria bacterium]
MHAVFNVALPVFAIMLCGYLAGRTKILGAGVSEALNGFTYYFALPALFFVSLAGTPIQQILNWNFIGATLLAILAVFAAAVAIARVLFPARVDALSLHALAGVFSNTGYMGIPLFVAAFGAKGTVPIIVVSIVQSTTIFLIAVALAELGASKSTSRIGVIKDMLRGVALNPLLVSSAAGIALSLTDTQMPKAFETFFKLLGDAAGPAALFAMGLFLVGKRIGKAWFEIGWISLIKLLIMPAAAFVAARYVFGLPEADVRDLTIACALPTATLVFVLAQKFNIFTARASGAILVTTIVSVVTVSALMIVFGVG